MRSFLLFARHPLCLAISTMSAMAAALPCIAQQPRKLDHSYRAFLLQARAEGYRVLNVFTLSRTPGRAGTDSLIGALAQIGARMQWRADEIGYVRAVLPLDSATQVVRLPLVAHYALGVSSPRNTRMGSWWGSIRVHGGDVSATSRATDTVPPDDAHLPLLTAESLQSERVYIPRDEIRADAFAALAPTADGRGVTIGIVEGALDFNHHAFRDALDLRGRRIDKIAGIGDASWNVGARIEPGTDISDSTLYDRRWRTGRAKLQTYTTLTTRDGAATVEGIPVRLPGPGTWHTGFWKRTTTSRSTDSSAYLVAWRDTMELWVDVDRDNDLYHALPVPNINVRFGAGSFPAPSAVANAVPTAFAVAFDYDGRPNIYQPYNDHTTMVAGTAAGSRFLESDVGGIAPGARVVLYTGVFPENFILAARDPRVDIITNQTSAEHYPSAARSFVGAIFERLLVIYRKPIFISAANAGPELGTVTSTGTSAGAVGVGAYVSKRSYFANQSWDVPDDDNLTLYSSRGPMSDGALKPDLVAPTQMVTPGGCGAERYRYPSVFRLPPCYMIGSGTSNSAPFAAGAAALLMSAARQAGLPARASDGPAIVWALTSSARLLPEIGVHEQGAGLIQVDSAWKLMQQLARLKATRTIVVADAPVENAYASLLASPGRGPGLLLREGWYAGRQDSREITLTRTAGPAAPVRYTLRWRGNDGTFALQDTSVLLPLYTPVQIQVHVAPQRPGIHSSTIDVIDRATQTVTGRVPVTVMANVPLGGDVFTAQYTDTISWPKNHTQFIDVPPGMGLLRIEMQALAGTLEIGMRGPRAGNNKERGVTILPGKDAVITIENPAAGSWEFTAAPPSFRAPAPPPSDQRRLMYRLTAAAFKVEGAVSQLQRTPTGSNGLFHITNAGAALDSVAVLGTIGIRRYVEGTITGAEYDTLSPRQVANVRVDSGATLLRVDLDWQGGKEQLALALFMCDTSGRCTSHVPATADTMSQTVTIKDPRPGTWQVFLDPAQLRTVSAPYRIAILTAHPRYGIVQIKDTLDRAGRQLQQKEERRVHFSIPQAPAVPDAELVGILEIVNRVNIPPSVPGRRPETPWNTLQHVLFTIPAQSQ